MHKYRRLPPNSGSHHSSGWHAEAGARRFLYHFTQDSDRAKWNSGQSGVFHLCSCTTVDANFPITELQFLFRLCNTWKRQPPAFVGFKIYFIGMCSPEYQFAVVLLFVLYYLLHHLNVFYRISIPALYTFNFSSSFSTSHLQILHCNIANFKVIHASIQNMQQWFAKQAQ